MEKDWFVFVQDHHRGPFEIKELQALYEEGLIQPSHFVWKEGLPDWKTLEELLTLSQERARGHSSWRSEQGPIDFTKLENTTKDPFNDPLLASTSQIELSAVPPTLDKLPDWKHLRRFQLLMRPPQGPPPALPEIPTINDMATSELEKSKRPESLRAPVHEFQEFNELHIPHKTFLARSLSRPLVVIGAVFCLLFFTAASLEKLTFIDRALWGKTDDLPAVSAPELLKIHDVLKAYPWKDIHSHAVASSAGDEIYFYSNHPGMGKLRLELVSLNPKENIRAISEANFEGNTATFRRFRFQQGAELLSNHYSVKIRPILFETPWSLSHLFRSLLSGHLLGELWGSHWPELAFEQSIVISKNGEAVIVAPKLELELAAVSVKKEQGVEKALEELVAETSVGAVEAVKEISPKAKISIQSKESFNGSKKSMAQISEELQAHKDLQMKYESFLGLLSNLGEIFREKILSAKRVQDIQQFEEVYTYNFATILTEISFANNKLSLEKKKTSPKLSAEYDEQVGYGKKLATFVMENIERAKALKQINSRTKERLLSAFNQGSKKLEEKLTKELKALDEQLGTKAP